MQLSLQCRAPFADLDHLPKVLGTRQFFNISKWKCSSRFSPVRILSTSSSKSAPRLRVSLRILCEIELSLQSCALFVDHFPRSNRATAETETILLRRPLYPKKSVWRPRAFSSLNSRVPDLSHFPTTYIHGDVVAMMIEVMMWLPSWWQS